MTDENHVRSGYMQTICVLLLGNGGNGKSFWRKRLGEECVSVMRNGARTLIPLDGILYVIHETNTLIDNDGENLAKDLKYALIFINQTDLDAQIEWAREQVASLIRESAFVRIGLVIVENWTGHLEASDPEIVRSVYAQIPHLEFVDSIRLDQMYALYPLEKLVRDPDTDTF